MFQTVIAPHASSVGAPTGFQAATNIIGTTMAGLHRSLLYMAPESVDDETTVLDVRTIDGEPFGRINQALQDLSSDEQLLLINSFEPEPLYDVLEQRGFSYETTQIDASEWHVTITKA